MEYMQRTRNESQKKSKYSPGKSYQHLTPNRGNRNLSLPGAKNNRYTASRVDYSLRYMSKNSVTQNNMPAYNIYPVRQATEHTAPIQMHRGEKGSVFDFVKLKKYLKFHIPQFSKARNIWQGRALSDEDLNNYAERVQTLFEDIRQVDLQFLAVTNASYEENGRDANNANHPELYKALNEKKLAYMHRIKRELVRERKDPNTSDEKREILLKYLRNVGRQIKFLQQIINKGEQNSYVFNVNTLLQGPDTEAYMVIPAPSPDTYKDIYIQNENTDDRELTMSSNKLQMGIDTPIRAFSWYIKYLLNSDEGIHNPPLIRKLKIPLKIFDEEILSRMVSEHRPGDNRERAPMNEDFKVENQFNIPKMVFERLVTGLHDAADRLETVGVSQKTPKSLLQGAGYFVELDDFKKQIGFARKKGNEIVATDIHFFDFEHTAFFQISNSSSRIRADLYSSTALKRKYDEVSELMENMILEFGTEQAINSPLVSISGRTIQNKELSEKIRILLEANYCMPPDRSYDLKGNDVNAIVDEKKFASDLFSEKETDTKIVALLNHTFERLELILQSNPRTRNTYIKKIQKDSGLLYEYQNVCAGYKDVPTLLMLWEQPNTFRGFLYKVATNKKLEVTAFALKILRIIKQGAQEGRERYDYKEDQQLEQELFARRMTGDHFNSVNMRNVGDMKAGRFKVHIPFDKMTSTGRFVPESQDSKHGEPKHSFVPFMGGASGTTRDISVDLMTHGLLADEKEYWDFQLLNSAFMIAYSYHSFVEVIFRAAAARREYYGLEPISSEIMEYLNFLNQQRDSVRSSELIQNIRRIIDKKGR